MSDTPHSMHVYNTYVKSCLDVLKLLYILAQPKVSVKVSIKPTEVGFAPVYMCLLKGQYKDSSCTKLGHLEL